MLSLGKGLTALKQNTFKKIEGKEKIACNQHFLLSPQYFLPHLKQISIRLPHLFCHLQILSLWACIKVCCKKFIFRPSLFTFGWHWTCEFSQSFSIIRTLTWYCQNSKFPFHIVQDCLNNKLWQMLRLAQLPWLNVPSHSTEIIKYLNE